MAVAKVVGAEVMHAKIMSFIDAWNLHDPEKILEHLTRDVVWTEPMVPETLVGKPAVRAHLDETFVTFPDLHMPIEDIEVMVAEEGGKAVATFTLIATMKGPFGGFGATGKTGRISGVCVYEFRGDLIGRHTVIYDSIDLAEQLGLLPSPTGLPMKMLAGAQRLTTRVMQLIPRR